MKKYIKYLLILLVGVCVSCSDYVYEPNTVRYEVVQYRNHSHVHYYPVRPKYYRPAPPPPKPQPPINNNKRNYGKRH